MFMCSPCPQHAFIVYFSDSRLMKINNVNRQVSYNVQTAVYAKYYLIVAHEVTNTSDRGQLKKLAQHTVGKGDITVLDDKGYYSRRILNQRRT